MAEPFAQLTYAERCEIGLKRKINEDSVGSHLPTTEEAKLGALFVVADGIGSIGGGEQASSWAVRTLLDTYYDPELDDEDTRERILAAIQDAQDAVHARARVLKMDALGTTIAGVVVLPTGRCCIFNVGDSRVYLLSGGTFEQVTIDQSYADPKVEPKKFKLTSYLGQNKPILPNLFERQLTPGDKLLICSDGLWGLVQNQEIADVMRRNPAQKAADALVDLVYERGARDNVTVAIVETAGAHAFRMMPVIWAVLALVVVGLLGFALLQSGVLAAQPMGEATITEAVRITEAPSVQPGVSLHHESTATRSVTATRSTSPSTGPTLVVRTATPTPAE